MKVPRKKLHLVINAFCKAYSLVAIFNSHPLASSEPDKQLCAHWVTHLECTNRALTSHWMF